MTAYLLFLGFVFLAFAMSFGQQDDGDDEIANCVGARRARYGQQAYELCSHKRHVWK